MQIKKMRRHQFEARQTERNEIEKQAKISTSKTIETDEETITKLLAGKVYEEEDIIQVAQKLFPVYGHDYSTQFRIIDKFDNFMSRFENVSVEPDKPIFAIFGKPKKRWVLFCIISNNDKNTILFKDPSGALVPFRLEKEIKKQFGDVEFIVQTKEDQKDDDEKSYGPLTVRNLKILLDFLKEKKDLKDFQSVKFSQVLELNGEKFDKVSSSTKDLGQNEKFKNVLKDFIDKLPLELGSGMLEYKRIMEEELEKGEEEADLDRIKQARQKYLTEKSVNKIKGDFQLNAKEKVDDKVKEYELEIQNQFPDEMKKLSDIFEVLDDVKVDDKLYKALENLSEILEIDYNKMKAFYQFKVSLEAKEEVQKLSLEDVKNIAQNLPPMRESLFSDCTPLEQLLREVTLGMDQDENLPIENSNKEIQKIEEKYHNVKERYHKWENTDIHTINTWALNIKGKLGTTDDDVCETIAIMDKALNLLTGGHRLRDTQILAVLIFFHGQNNKGRLCQIKTGEGKTVIVSLLAIIRALQGVTVDVITSNPLLAADGVAETKTFFSAFGLTVATNNPGESKACYTADVLYGTISSFQFDFLKDTFEGFNIRSERKFGQVILDEVDSMLVDNGGHIAKLAAPYPGMECLRYIYINIWQELHKAEDSFVKECQAEIKKFLQYPTDETRAKYSEFIGDMIKNERKIIKEKIKASNPTNVPLIPYHLKDYVSSKLDIWIKNALHAKYNCHEHQQYRIITNDSNERVIAPVDYLNTGVTMKNTVWSNGLHQFVQLKHNLYLTFETLTSSFISNIGYIKNYKDENIFGLTGTLGSRAEQELLSEIYNIDYAKIPTYKAKKFEELPGIVTDDDSWAKQVTIEVLAMIDESRAVLVICETEQDLLSVEKNLRFLQREDKFRIRKYANEDNAKETREKVQIGDVILATNIAGRGTNFRTEKNLEENGGLHVCVGFLPCNLRVEGQAFGRTSRQGNHGTAQLILRRSEVDELNIVDNTPDFTEIKRERDNLERSRLKQINDVLVKELNFKDELFKYFSDFHRNLKREKMTESYRYVLQDLKEFWAFWLEKKNFTAKIISNTTPEREFNAFLSESNSIIRGTITHNPYYCVSLGEHYLEKEKNDDAARVLKQAIEMGGNQNCELLTGAHMKLFELAILNGHQVRERFKKAVAKIFFINVEKNEGYKQAAKTHLEHARVSIRKEIDYINNYIKEDGNPDFQRILLKEEDNLFLKHTYSRLFCLKAHDGNIDNLLDMVNNLKEGIGLNGKAPTTLDNFLKMSDDPEIKKILTGCEMMELQSIGIDSIYALREIHDVPDAVIHTAQGQIIGGIAALCVGLAFLPIFPAMSSVAGTLISEGIIDIVMQILTQGGSDFDSNDFLKGKFISYGVSLISFGISAITQSVKILSKAVSFCRKLSSFLRKSKYLKSLCNKLANYVDKLGDILENMLNVAKFNKLSAADQLDELQKLQKAGNTQMFEKLGGVEKMNSLGKIQNLRKSEVLLKYTSDFAWKTAKNVGYTLTEELVVKPLLNEILKQVIEQIKEHFKNKIRNSIQTNDNLMMKVRSTPRNEIDDVVESFTKENEVLKTAQEVGTELAGLCNSQFIDVLTISANIAYKMAEFERYNLALTTFLKRKLNGGNCVNDANEVIEDICVVLADKMFEMCCDIMKDSFKFVEMGIDWGKKKVEQFIENGDGEYLRPKKKVDIDDDSDDAAKKSTKRQHSENGDANSTQKRILNDSDDDSDIVMKRKDKKQSSPSSEKDNHESDDGQSKAKKKNDNQVIHDEDFTTKQKHGSDRNDEFENVEDISSKTTTKSDYQENDSMSSNSAFKSRNNLSTEDSDNESSTSKSKNTFDDDKTDIEKTSPKTKIKSNQEEEDDTAGNSSKRNKTIDDKECLDEDTEIIKNHGEQEENKESIDSQESKKTPNEKMENEESTSRAEKKSKQNEKDDDSDYEESGDEDTTSKTKKNSKQKEENKESIDLLEPKKKSSEESEDEESTSEAKKKSKQNEKDEDADDTLTHKKKTEGEQTSKKTINNDQDKEIDNDNSDPSTKKTVNEEYSDNEDTSSMTQKKSKQNENTDENSTSVSHNDDDENEESTKKKKKKEKLKKIGQILQDKLLEPLLNAALEECIQQIRDSLKNSLNNSIRSNKILITKLQTTPYDAINNVINNFLKGNTTFNMAKNIGFRILGVLKNKAITTVTTIFDIIKNSVDFGIYINACASYLEKNLDGGDCDNNVDGIVEQISSTVANHLCKLLKDIGKGHIQLVKMSYEWDKNELKKIFNSKEIMMTITNLETWKEIGTILLEEGAFQPIIDKIIEEIKNVFKKELNKSIHNNKSLINKLQTAPSDHIDGTVDEFIKNSETSNIANNISFKLLSLVENKSITTITAAVNIITDSIDFSSYFQKFSSFLDEHLHGGDCNNDTEQIAKNICAKAADRMVILLQESGKNVVRLGDSISELKGEDVKNLFSTHKIMDAITDKKNWENFGQLLIKEEVLQALLDELFKKIVELLKNNLKNSIKNHQNLVNKLQSASSNEINDVLNAFIEGNETINMAKNISLKLLGLLKHKAITALISACEITMNFVDLSKYSNNFSSYLDEHLRDGNCQNNFDEINEHICSKVADQIYAILKDTSAKTIQLIRTTSELKADDFKRLLNKHKIVSALTNKETWKTVIQNTVKENVFQPLIDKIVEDIKNSLRDTLKTSIKNNNNLIKKIQTTSTDQLEVIFVTFMDGNETLNIATNISKKVSDLVQHKAITALTTAFDIIKNSIDFADYISKLSSYLEEHLSGGNYDNEVDKIIDEMCTKAADRMFSLLKDTGRDTVELIMVGYELRNENCTKVFSKDEMFAALTDKKKWKQLEQTIINEEVLQPLIDKAEEEVKYYFKKLLKEKIKSNDILVKKLQAAAVDQSIKTIYMFMEDNQTLNMVKKISDKISGLTNNTAITALTTIFSIVKNSIDFDSYINKFSSYLQEHLLDIGCNNIAEDVIETICTEAADQMFSLLKDVGKDTLQLAKTGYELKNKDLTQILDKDKLVAAVSDKEKWKQMGQIIIKEEVLQPLMDQAVEEIKYSFKETLKNSINSDKNLVKKLQTSPVDDITVNVNNFMKGNETLNNAKKISDKISGFLQNESITTLTTTFGIIKNSIEFAAYINLFTSYMQEHISGGTSDNKVDEIIEVICSTSSEQMYSLLKKSGENVIELAKISYEFQNEDFVGLFDKDEIVASITDKTNWKKIGQTFIKEEVLHPLMAQGVEEIKQSFKKSLKESINNNNNLLEKFQFASADQINDTVNEYMNGDETLSVVRNISHKISTVSEHKVVTVLNTIGSLIKNSVDFTNYFKTFCLYLEEHLPRNDCKNSENVTDITEEICANAANHMFYLLQDSANDAVELVTFACELKHVDLTKVLNKDQIVNTLADKETWKQIGQTIVKDEVLQPLIDKAAEELKNTLEQKLVDSIRSNESLVKKLQTSPSDKIHYVVGVFMKGDETINAAKIITEKISKLVERKSITALTKTLSIIKNSVDIAEYISQFVSYLEENLSAGDFENNVEELIDEICPKVAGRMYSLLKNTGKDVVELAKISCSWRNEYFIKSIDKKELVAALTDKEKWVEIKQTIIKEGVLQPLIDKSVKDIKGTFEDTLKKSVTNNDILMQKFRNASVTQINRTLDVSMASIETINVVKNMSDSISGFVQNKRASTLMTTFGMMNNMVDFTDYINNLSSCLEEHLTEEDHSNNLDEIVETVSCKLADHIFSLLQHALKNRNAMQGVIRKLNIHGLKKFEISQQSLTVPLKKARAAIVPVLEKCIDDVSDENLKTMLNISVRKAVEVVTPKLLEDICAQIANLITEENFEKCIENVVPYLTQKVIDKISTCVYDDDEAIDVAVYHLAKSLTTSLSNSLSEVVTNEDVRTVIRNIEEGVVVEEVIEDLVSIITQLIEFGVSSLILDEILNMSLNHNVVEDVLAHLTEEIVSQISDLICNEDIKTALYGIRGGASIDTVIETMVTYLKEETKKWVDKKDFRDTLIKYNLGAVIDTIELQLNEEFSKRIYKFVCEKDIYEVLS